MLKDEIGIFHALLARHFWLLIVYIALVTTQTWRRLNPVRNETMRAGSFRKVVFITTAAIYLQLALGATMRHQHRDLSIPDFPTAYGSWWPDTSAERITEINAARDKVALSDVTAFQIWLQMAHRFGAILVAAGIATAAIRVGSEFRGQTLLRRLTFLWLGLLLCQLTLGAWTIWSNKAAGYCHCACRGRSNHAIVRAWLSTLSPPGSFASHIRPPGRTQRRRKPSQLHEDGNSQ